ncbi:MAG: PAS domain-containing protein [Ferruginibacter sp.]
MTVKLFSKTKTLAKPTNKYPAKPITETLTNGFFTVDDKWTVQYWNQSAEKITGVKAKDVIGTNLWKNFFAGVIPKELYTLEQYTFLQNEPVHFEKYWGEMGDWDNVITYHCDNTLSVSFKSSKHAHSEISKNPAQQLKILTELYRFVTEITNDCLWEWNLQEEQIFWIDGGHHRIFGYLVENALIPQIFWESCIHPDDKERVLKSLNKTIHSSTPLWEAEYRFKKADSTYAYVHDRGHIIYDKDKQALRMIGATRDITETVLLENKLVEERLTKQREITNAILTAQENERANIGTDLNENLNQMLVVIKWYIQMAKTDKDKRDVSLKKSTDYIAHVINEIRKISKTLVIPGIHLLGLFDNIKNLIEDIQEIDPVKIKFKTSGIDEEYLNEKMQVTIYRIVQEQLNNIIKHAGAALATISLYRHANEIILSVSDNGKGCNLLQEKNGVGIINIKSRAGLFGGIVIIKSKPSLGYELKVVFPYFTTDSDLS